MSALYHTNTVIGKLKIYFEQFFDGVTSPTKKHLLHLILSILALDGYQSIKFNYDHFISAISSYQLKSYYYTLNESKIDLNIWLHKLLQLALKLLPPDQSQPLVLSIDDTMVEKFGAHFECRSKLYDHAQHNGSNYLNGHCFVCLLLSIPIQTDGQCGYLNIPLAYRMWTKEKSKLDIASELVQTAMEIIGHEQSVVLCCDSWYPKGSVLNLPLQFKNLDMICNVRSDTVIYDLAPERTGKKGRPKARGDKLGLDDFMLMDIPLLDYLVGYRPVLTNLFGNKTVFAIVTQPRSGGSKRLFLCTKMPEELDFDINYLAESARTYAQSDEMLLPLSIYSLRWNIEVAFYEQKTFWSLNEYKLRSRVGIERLVNLTSLVYSAVILLPWVESDFSYLQENSAQESRFLLGDAIRKQTFLLDFASRLEKHEKYSSLATRLLELASQLLETS